MADSNGFPGIDIARLINISILAQYDKAIAMYRRYYQYEQINGVDRITIEKIPEKAFREAVANALVHRTWDINANIRILLFDNRIEISSPGGLPSEIREDEYLNGNKVLEALRGGIRYSSSELAVKMNWSKDKVIRTLNVLVADGYVTKYGTGRSTKYSRK